MLDELELAGIEAIDLAEYDVKIIERVLQCRVALGRQTGVIALRYGKADDRAGDHRHRQDRQQDCGDARGIPTRHQSAGRPARPPPCPWPAGCCSGLHPYAPPLLTEAQVRRT